MTAKTLSCSTSFLTAASALVGEWPSSSNTATILRPLTPPAALISLIASNMPSRPARPMYAAGPVIGPCAPMVIVSEVTPCCWATTGSATASIAAAAASSSLFMVLLLWPMSALGKTDWAGAQNSGARSVLSMTQGTIYNYVSPKDDILYVVCHRIVAEYNEQAAQDARHVARPLGRVRSAVRAISQVMYRHRGEILLNSSTAAHPMDPRRRHPSSPPS